MPVTSKPPRPAVPPQSPYWPDHERRTPLLDFLDGHSLVGSRMDLCHQKWAEADKAPVSEWPTPDMLTGKKMAYNGVLQHSSKSWERRHKKRLALAVRRRALLSWLGKCRQP